MKTDVDTDKVEEIIRHVAATEVMPRFKNLSDGDIREKKPGDFVTVADEASERLFSQLLSELLPGSLVVGEEAVSKDQDVLKKFSEDRPVWVIDPIDGTYNFSHGRSKFGILIALVRNGVTEYGWAFDAPGNRMAAAGKGVGAFLDGKRLKITDAEKSLKDIVLQGGGAQAWHFDPIRSVFKDIINLRCSLHDFMNFLTGDADAIVHVNKATPWDHAANVLLAEEFGAYVRMGDGRAYDPAYYGQGYILAAQNEKIWHKIHAATYETLKK